MDTNEKAIEMHKKWNGKLETISKTPVKTREDLSIAYTPGVAAPCRIIAENKEEAYTYTMKANTVAVVSDGSAVLGLGNIGPYAAMPVMEGKCVLFKEFGNVNAVPICLDTQDTEEIIKTVKNIAPGFGGINLEDISAPRCFEIEERLKEMLDIPVFIDRSSYESQPLGRTEWIKLYGAMLDKEEEAADFFANQASIVENLKDFQNTEKTVAFFYINTSGAAVVRNPEDYISNMIELGGARNAFRDLQDDSGKTSVPITMEQFYDTAEDADYLIYNASIDSTVKTLDDLLAKDSMFADYKAVKEGNVWTTEKSMYQATDKIAQFTNDINLLVTGGDPDQMVFLRKLS